MSRFTIFALILVLGSGFAFYAFWQSWQLYRKIQGFQVVEGRILKKSVGLKRLASSSGPRAKYRVDCLYEFEVDGRLWQGENYYSIELLGGEIAVSEEEARNHLYQMGYNVSVFYNPMDPGESFLVANSGSHWLFLGVGVFLMFASAVVLGMGKEG